MKKISALAVMVAAAAICGGCSMKKTEKASEPETTFASEEASADNATAASEAASGEKTTEAAKKPDAELKAEAGVYVYDLAGLMTDEQKKACGEYLGELYGKYMLGAAVVTTSDLKEKTPYAYAAEVYHKIYGDAANGFLYLINNDTNEDYLYKTGICQRYVTTDMEKEAFFTATRDIVSGDCESAVKTVMKLGEKCPSLVFDEAEAFTAPETEELVKTLSSAGYPAVVAAVKNSDAKKDNKALAQEIFKRRFADGKGVALLIDLQKKEVAAYPPDALSAELTEALKKAGESAAKSDWGGAAKLLAEAAAKSEKPAESAPATTAPAENNTEAPATTAKAQ